MITAAPSAKTVPRPAAIEGAAPPIGRQHGAGQIFIVSCCGTAAAMPPAIAASHSPAIRLWQARCTATRAVEQAHCTVSDGPVRLSLKTSGRDEILVGRDDRGKASRSGRRARSDRTRSSTSQCQRRHRSAWLFRRPSCRHSQAPPRRIRGRSDAADRSSRFARVEAEEARVEKVEIGQRAVGSDHVGDLIGEGRGGRILLGSARRVSRPDLRMSQSSSRLAAPGKRPDIPTMAMSFPLDMETDPRLGAGGVRIGIEPLGPVTP